MLKIFTCHLLIKHCKEQYEWRRVQRWKVRRSSSVKWMSWRLESYGKREYYTMSQKKFTNFWCRQFLNDKFPQNMRELTSRQTAKSRIQ